MGVIFREIACCKRKVTNAAIYKNVPTLTAKSIATHDALTMWTVVWNRQVCTGVGSTKTSSIAFDKYGALTDCCLLLLLLLLLVNSNGWDVVAAHTQILLPLCWRRCLG
jgi:hypothetical protein